MTRTEEKQASRDADWASLKSGEKSAEQLRRENSFMPPESWHAPIDFTKVRSP